MPLLLKVKFPSKWTLSCCGYIFAPPHTQKGAQISAHYINAEGFDKYLLDLAQYQHKKAVSTEAIVS